VNERINKCPSGLKTNLSGSKCIRNEWILIKDGKAKSFKFHHTLYAGQELKDRLFEAGFREVKLYGNLEGDAYGTDAERLVAVACK
jgi:hypothetical protein